jgi:hypothetical protein
MIDTGEIKKHGYFNRESLIHIILWLAFFTWFDGDYLDLEFDADALSISFHVKFAICLLYIFGIKELNPAINRPRSVVAALHFSVFAFCGWFALATYLLPNVPISGYAGILLLFGCLSGLILLTNAFIMAQQLFKEKSKRLLIVEVILKSSLFALFCASLLMIIYGDWQWPINAIFDW